MSSKRYAEEFKMEAVKQITERRYPVAGGVGAAGSVAAQFV
jgi:transposase-like protein